MSKGFRQVIFVITVLLCILGVYLLFPFQKSSKAEEHYKVSRGEDCTGNKSQEYGCPDYVDPDPSTIRLLCWNIQGLEIRNTLLERTKYVCDLINKEQPQVVFLQEVVPDSVPILRAECKSYHVIVGGERHYFTAILLHSHHVKHHVSTITPFPNSRMLRNMLSVQCSVKGVKLEVITSHLESTVPAAEERKKQLVTAYKTMQGVESDRTVIFGGDLNIEDSEVAEVGGPPPDILDLWELTGHNPSTKYTWDGRVNDNPPIGFWRNRIDRLYMRHSIPTENIKPVTFELVGKHRLPCGKFPSDHFGLLVAFQKIDNST